ncbi:hypothetical protein RQP46_003918 [Phenoliferia psychrophenolica]
MPSFKLLLFTVYGVLLASSVSAHSDDRNSLKRRDNGASDSYYPVLMAREDEAEHMGHGEVMAMLKANEAEGIRRTADAHEDRKSGHKGTPEWALGHVEGSPTHDERKRADYSDVIGKLETAIAGLKNALDALAKKKAAHPVKRQGILTSVTGSLAGEGPDPLGGVLNLVTGLLGGVLNPVTDGISHFAGDPLGVGNLLTGVTGIVGSVVKRAGTDYAPAIAKLEVMLDNVKLALAKQKQSAQ